MKIFFCVSLQQKISKILGKLLSKTGQDKYKTCLCQVQKDEGADDHLVGEVQVHSCFGSFRLPSTPNLGSGFYRQLSYVLVYNPWSI